MAKTTSEPRTQNLSMLSVFTQRKMAAILLLGFGSGLPLYLTSRTLQAWMTVEGVDLTTIGLFSLVSLPYSLKFLWAPAFDRYIPPFLGRRRGWLGAIYAHLHSMRHFTSIRDRLAPPSKSDAAAATTAARTTQRARAFST